MDYQTNWLKYIAERLKGSELKEILHMVENSGHSDAVWLKDKKFNRNLLTEYIRQRKLEEEIARKKKERAKDLKRNLRKYGLTEPITKQELKQWDREEKRKKADQNPPKKTADEQASEYARENEGTIPLGKIPPKRK